MPAEAVGEDCPNQGGETAENNIGKGAACEQIGQQTAHKKSRYGGRGEIRQNGKSLGETHLNCLTGKTQGVGDKGEHYIERGDHRCTNKEQRRSDHSIGVLCFHLLFSFSFVLGEEGLELTDLIVENPVFAGFLTFLSITRYQVNGKLVVV